VKLTHTERSKRSQLSIFRFNRGKRSPVQTWAAFTE
jgi:hypothetical protein